METRELRILNWNIRGIMSSALCLSNILDSKKPDVAVICEHKLSNPNLTFLDSIHSDYKAYPSRLTTDVTNTVATLVKKDLIQFVSIIEEYSNDRIVLLEIAQSAAWSFYICGVYLPYDNDVEHYKYYVNNLYDIMSVCTDKTIILAGDFNARAFEIPYSYVPKVKSQTLSEFIKYNNLMAVNRSSKNNSVPYTFLPTRTTLDYIMIDRQNFDLVLSYETLQTTDVELASDHLAMLCTMSIPVTPCFQSQSKSLPAWHKATSEMFINYQLELHNKLSYLANIILVSENEIELYLSTVTNTLIQEAKAHIPVSKFVPYIKPYWTADVKQAHANARIKRKLWVDENRPRGMIHESYKQYKAAKNTFRNVQQKAIFEHENETFNQLNSTAENDIRLFWRLFKHTKSKQSNICTKLSYDSVEARCPQTIADLFGAYFQSLYESNKESYGDKINPQGSPEDIHSNFSISLDDVIKNVKSLKKKKSPGIDMVQSEHIIYGGRTVFKCLANLFGAIINLNYIPYIWKTGLLVPIYKGPPKQRNNPDSYRAVTLLSVFYKLFEKIINEKLLNVLTKNHPEFPCKQQQGFQKELSSITVAFNLHETIYSVIELNSIAYVAFLDIRKAFDTVNNSMLFKKMDEMQIPKQITNIIQQAYIGMKSIVFINGKQSKPFKIKNGVRQGGVLSSLLFLIFIDGLLKELEQSGLGAFICELETGNPTLADDLSLVAITPLNLQKMLLIAERYMNRWLLTINYTKSFIVIVSNRKITSSVFRWTINSHPLEITSKTTHVGIQISSDMKSDYAIENAVRKGRAAFHSALGFSFKKQMLLSPVTSLRLYKSVVQPTFLYGCEMWSNMSSSSMKAIEVFHRYCIKKIQHLPVTTRTAMCQTLLGVGSLIGDVDKRKLMFFHKILSLPERALTKQIFLRRLFLHQHRTMSSCTVKHLGFIPDLKRILLKYKLNEYLENVIMGLQLPSKYCWKRIIGKSIRNYEMNQLNMLYAVDSDFSRYRKIHTTQNIYHLWKLPTTVAELRLIQFIVKCITLIPQNLGQVCSYCNYTFKDVFLHIVTSCKVTLEMRNTFLEYIVDNFTPQFSIYVTDLEHEELLCFLLGRKSPQTQCLDTDEYNRLIMVSANYIVACCKQFYQGVLHN